MNYRGESSALSAAAGGGDEGTRAVSAIGSAHNSSGSFSRNPFTPRDRPPSGLRTGGTISGGSPKTALAAATVAPPASASPGSGARVRGRSKETPVPGGARLPAQENFLSSLHLDQEQMSDFHNSEGHFLYLRQKAGADATAYNLEVRTIYSTWYALLVLFGNNVAVVSCAIVFVVHVALPQNVGSISVRFRT